MAVHSALQVFRPFTKTASDGLYPCRMYVYIGALCVPILVAGLAFINPGTGYESLGAFCTLPIRPFWYRLALAWIPRYLVALVIIGLAVAIKIYVDSELHSINRNIVASQTNQLSRLSRIEGSIAAARTTSNTMHHGLLDEGKGSVFTRYICSRRPCVNTCTGFCSWPVFFAPGTSMQSNIESTTGQSPKYAETPFMIPFCCRAGPASCTTQLRTAPTNRPLVEMQTDLRSADTRLTAERCDCSPNTPASTTCSRTRIRRQLRLIFIYPLVYTLMWLIPFAHHCTMYFDRYVEHPLWSLRIGATICISSMGFIDCLIFFLREKPWQKIALSDMTLWGSCVVCKPPTSKTARIRGSL